MNFTYFEIENFRGIVKARLDLLSTPRSRIYSLVGLNESGKTTILEAINYFKYKKESLKALGLHGSDDAHSLIPMAHRSNFNGRVLLRTGIAIEPRDRAKLFIYLSKQFDFKLADPILHFNIETEVAFKNSKLDFGETTNVWDITFSGRFGKQKKIKQLSDDQWHEAVSFLETLLPSILYFPNFLFEFPEKIVLDEKPEVSSKDSFYRLVIQDILDALDNGTNIQTHIIERARSADANDKKNLNSLLLEMGRNVTQNVFKSWDQILKSKIGNKKIIISCEIDDKDHCCLSFKVEDADGIFGINERSLGFRWFFVYLLLTHYRGFRKASENKVLFLLDEPASNLHSTAQAQLLESFAQLRTNCQLIYTTHSHHLLNPDWLETTYVVKNDGLDYKNDVATFNSNKTNITLTRYREFAVKHPNQTSYYQPILDILEYSQSRFESIPDIVMVEGKNDFYTLNYFQNVLSENPKKLALLPGTGSGNLDAVIRLYIAWGKNFIILLDGDKEGKKQRLRYQELFELSVHDRIFCLDEIDSSWGVTTMETVFATVDKEAIQQAVFPTEKSFVKVHFNRAIQELGITRRSVSISKATLDRLSDIVKFLNAKLDRLSNAKK